jgi:hypothetical protein
VAVSIRAVPAALVVLLVAVIAPAARAAGPVVTQRGMHDARYCELFELRGTPPDASAIIWNTIGLNDCPQAAWEAIDTTALARERGDVAIIRNGPRHFLMDRATARAHGLRARLTGR